MEGRGYATSHDPTFNPSSSSYQPFEMNPNSNLNPHPHSTSTINPSSSSTPTTRKRANTASTQDGAADQEDPPTTAKGKGRAVKQRASIDDSAATTTTTKGKGKGKETAAAKKKGAGAKRAGANEDGTGATKKRRRVVVACDVCRRKKIACKPQPDTNPADPTSAPCANCHDYDYKCTFSAEPDRSRGKFEILEARFDSLLRAFKEANPEKAAEYEEGNGWSANATTVKKEEDNNNHNNNSNRNQNQNQGSSKDNEIGSSSSGANSTANSNHPGIDSSTGTPSSTHGGGSGAHHHHQQQQQPMMNMNHLNNHSIPYQPSFNSLPAPHIQYRSFNQQKPGGFPNSLLPPPPPLSSTSANANSHFQLPPLSRSHHQHQHHSYPHSQLPHSGPVPMLPDLEDGRPRYFGSSSTLSLFSTVNSRPPSPTGGNRLSLTSSSSSSRNHHQSSNWFGMGDRRLGGGGGGAGSSELPLSSSRIGSRNQSRNNSDDENDDDDDEDEGHGGDGVGKENSKGRRGSNWNNDVSRRTSDVRNSQQGGSSAVMDSSRKSGSSSKESGSNFSRMVLPRPRPLYPNNSKEWVAYLRRKNLTAVGRDDAVNDEWFNRYQLPSADILYPLLTLFFTHLHPLMPILHPPSLLRDISLNRPSHDSAFRGLIFCIIAIAARFSDDVRVRTDPDDPDTAGDEYAAGSRLYHQVHAASLTNVQILILTSTFLHSSVGSGTSWLLLGMAIRGLLDIGLHQEKADADLPPFEREIRRRTFWGAFILDCVFAVNMGRPMALRLSDCHVRLPLSVTDETLMRAEGGGPIPREATSEPTIMDGFIHLIRLNVLVQDIVEALYNPKWLHHKMPLEADWEEDDTFGQSWDSRKPEYKDMMELSKRLDDWEAAIPAHVSNINDSPYRLQAAILSCGKHDMRMYIYKPFLSDVHLRRTLHPQCVPHARECVRTVNELYQSGNSASLVFIFQQAFMSTATFLITVWHTAEEEEVLAQDNQIIESTLKMFNALEDRFSSPIFRKAHRMLRNIAARTLRTIDSREHQERIIALIKASDPHLLTISSIHRSGLQTPANNVQQGSNLLIPNHSPGTTSPSAALSAYTQWVGASPLGTPGGSSNVLNNFKLANGRGGAQEFQHPFNSSNQEQHPPHLGVATPSNAALFNNVLENELEDLSASQGTFAGLGVAGGGDGLGGGSTQMEDLGWTEYFTKFLSEIGSGNNQNVGGVEDGNQGPTASTSNHHQNNEVHSPPPPAGTHTPHSTYPTQSPNPNLNSSSNNSSHVFSHYSNSHTRTGATNESSSRPRTRPPTPSFIRSRPQTPNGLPLGLTPPPAHH